MIDYDDVLEYAFEAMENAYAPYSNYQVGACVKLKDGTFVPGANVENAAYGSTMCAERNAIYGAYSRGYRKEDIEALAIVCKGKRVATPCGACRQVLGELLLPDTPIILSNKETTQVTNIQTLLPDMFGEEDLQ